MIVTSICWLLFVLGLAIACVLAGNSLTLALLVTLLVLPLLFSLLNLLGRKKLKLELRCPVNQKKEQADAIELTLENTSRVPLVAVRCQVEVLNLLTGSENVIRCRASILPRNKRVLTLDLCSRYCGRISVRVQRVRLYDCFWLLPVPCGQTAAATVTVQPNTFPQTVTIAANFNSPDDSEIYSQEKPGPDLSETFQIRDYRPGDSIRQMHWKLTQKFDRPIVRDPSLPITRSVLLLWERTADIAETAEEADVQAEALVSLAKTLLDQSVQFNLAWNEKESGQCALLEIRSMDDLIGALPRLLSASALTGGVCGGELFCQTAQETNYSHIVYVTRTWTTAAVLLQDMGHVTVLLCGTEANAADFYGEVVCFDRLNYEQQLQELNI